MSEMVERVAREIGSNLPCDAYSPNWPMPCNTFSCKCMDLARAAIAAMREPTEEMKSCEGVHWGYSCHVCGGLTEGWQAMIDRALK